MMMRIENNKKKVEEKNGKSQVEASGGDGVGEKWNEGKMKSLKAEKFYVAQKKRESTKFPIKKLWFYELFIRIL